MERFKMVHTSQKAMTDVKALLVQRRDRKDPNLLSEFEALAQTAGYEVAGTFDIVSAPSAKYGIRAGKVEEIETWIEVNEPDFVLFSPTLKSGQMFRLIERWEIEVRDRTQVILEIFDRHARTPQAKLQIEQARLRYELPFQRHQIRIRLQQEHVGDRPIADQVGPGESPLEIHIQHIRKRIAFIESKLDTIARKQRLKRRGREKKGFQEVTIAGYTNAGKSTLHNAITGSEVEVADQLFTTLSTKTSTIPIPGRQTVLTDSVGFISDLPRALLRAFNTTLMEIAEADVIVLVVDGSDTLDEIERKLNTCLETFVDIEANGIPVVIALNKVDLLEEEELTQRIELIESDHSEVVPISALNGTNLEELLKTVERNLTPLTNYRLVLPYVDSSMSLLSWLHDVTSVSNQEYSKDTISVDVMLDKVLAQKLSKMVTDGTLTKTDE
ncbi:MAG: GTPase HflX [Candidatus Thorarchaeota archaeon]|jgi:GTP-binding protein HflX